MDITLPPDFKEFLRLLNTYGVDYLLHHRKVNKQASGRYKDLDDLEHLP